MGNRIGFVSTRFQGTDGVSLESEKWAKILSENGHACFWFAGKLDRDPNASMLVPHAYFGHSDIKWINDRIYGKSTRSPEVTARIYAISDHLKREIYDFVKKFEIDVLCVQNALTIPMNVPLGVALTNFIAETGFPTINHHHDFYWERDRFSVNAIGDLLNMAFPPSLPSIQNATINSAAQQSLAWRCGISSILVPNVLHFEEEPPEADEYARSFRAEIGIHDDDILFLQPTRVVARKGIEHSISLVKALNNPRVKLVISHDSGDEGHDYQEALIEMAEHSDVDMRFVNDRVGEQRGSNAKGQRVYTLSDAYSQADFITYPSLYEGFGNALLEAFYFRKPVLVNRYSIFIRDIEPRGFQVITMDGYLTREVVRNVNQVIQNPDVREAMVRRNFELGRAYFGYAVLRRKLRALVANVTGMDETAIKE